MSSAAYDPPRDPPVILWRDAHLLVVDKPAGLLSVPGRGEDLADCMIARLQARDPEVRLVHRLDRDTSGVMVFARSRAAQRHLGLQFERRHTAKSYVALVWGVPEAEAGAVDLPIIVDWPNRPRQKVDPVEGRPARTRWQVLAREGEVTRVALMPETGRSHQLRLHMREIGHPILGDQLYASGPALDAPRLMLHSERLSLHHPEGGATVEFTAPCPF